ncbi:MAG: oligosaccharide flippase family protein [Bacteroidales bacterium]|nr:oligosaccharide flippase family protein [Bacteroidales bacterium]
MKVPSIVRETFTLMSGSVAAQTITLVAYFVLTRIYSPADYGLFNIFYSYIEVLVILSTCKYELAAVVATDDGEAAAVSRFALRLNAAVSIGLLTAVLVLWLTGNLPGNFAQLGWMVLLIPPMVFFCGTSRIYSFLYNRFRRYGKIAAAENVNAGVGAGLKWLLGWMGFVQWGLPVGTVLGQAMANIGYRLGLRGLNLPPTGRSDRRNAARRHSNFPRYVASKELLTAVSANLPFLWVAAYFQQAEVGFFGLALTFTRQPVLLLCSVFERVLYARGAEAVRQKTPLRRMVFRFAAASAVGFLPFCIAAWFLAEPLFGFAFGSRWQGCAPYVKALLPWAWITLTTNSLMFASNIFSTQRIDFFFHLALLVLRVVALAVGIVQDDFLLAVRLFAFVSALTSIALAVWYMLQVSRYERQVEGDS